VRQVIALHHGHTRRRQTQLHRQLADTAGRRTRIGRAEVADDRNVVDQAQAEDRRQELVQQRFVAMLGIVATCQLRKRQRAFGQRFEDQRGRSARGNQRAHHWQGGVGAVTGKSGAGADQQGTVMAFPKLEERTANPF
jgi:hypothetical protein